MIYGVIIGGGVVAVLVRIERHLAVIRKQVFRNFENLEKNYNSLKNEIENSKSNIEEISV